jgi:large subunit ribosomal protein L21
MQKPIFAPQLSKVYNMYAIVDIAGKQFKVKKDQFVYAPSMEGEEGASVEFDRVLLIDGDQGVHVGTPVVSGAKVTGKILDHGRGDKVIVFKKKRRKGYKKTQGHRQNYTKVLIEDILASGQGASAKKEAAPKKEAKKAESAQDDLTKIKGIGEVYAGELNGLGYTSFKQISELSEEDIKKIADAIDGVTEDTIQNDDWMGQAKELLK